MGYARMIGRHWAGPVTSLACEEQISDLLIDARHSIRIRPASQPASQLGRPATRQLQYLSRDPP